MVSHFIMDGGILKVTDQNAFDFEYIRDLKRGKRRCIVENKTEKFRFFIDFDYKGPTVLPDSQIIDFAVTCAQVLSAKCYIAKTTPRRIDDAIKTGVHFHFPSLVVTKQDAIKLRNKVCLKVPQYSSCIDTSVYAGSGLRLVWSHKFQNGQYYDPYVPWKCIGPDGIVKPLPPDPEVDLLRLFTIRTDEELGEDVPQETLDPLESFIQKYIPGQTHTRVTGIKDRLIKTNSRFCERIQREHQSNHVWFVITDKGTIQQLCLDEECKGYRGREYIFHHPLFRFNKK